MAWYVGEEGQKSPSDLYIMGTILELQQNKELMALCKTHLDFLNPLLEKNRE